MEQNTNTRNKTLQLSIFALYMAIICIVTMFTKIPIPLGYAHIGDSIILTFALFYGGKNGFVVGGIGSALSDLLSGFPQWILPTFIIKGFMALIMAAIARKEDGTYKILSIRTFIGAIAGMLFMVAGYVAAGMVMNGFAAGLASAPGLLIKSVVNIIAFYIISVVLDKTRKIEKKF